MNRIKEFIHEIHRRSLWQVLGIFLASSWGVLQAVEFVTDLAGLPDWTPAMALVLLMIGLPICLATAFVQEGLPGHQLASGPPDDTAASGVLAADGEMAKETDTPSAHAGTPGTRRFFTWRNAILGGVGAFALLGFSLIAYFVMWTTGVGPVGSLVAQGIIDERDPVLLAEFDNRTGDETLGAVVTDALRVDLLESKVVTLVEESLVDETLQRMGRDPTSAVNSAIAREVAVREGVKAVIEGDVSSIGAGYVLAVQIVSPEDGTSFAAFRENADSDEELLPAIDRLSQKLRERAGESLRDIRAAEPLEAVTTSSLDALRLYVQGDQSIDESDDEAGVAFLEQALAHDSTFAMAWRKLAVAHTNAGQLDAAATAARAAYRHRERLTERERYLAEAYYHRVVTLDDEARADAYRRVLEIQPDDPTALNNLSLFYRGRQDWERARELLVRAVDGPGRSNTAYLNLAVTLYDLGDPEGALATIEMARELYPRYSTLLQVEAEMLWGTGDHQGAIDAAGTILDVFPDDNVLRLEVLGLQALVEASRGQIGAARRLQNERSVLATSLNESRQVFASELQIFRLDLLEGQDTTAALVRLENRFEDVLADVAEFDRPYGTMATLWAEHGDGTRTQFWAERALAALPAEASGSMLVQMVQRAVEASMTIAREDYAGALEQYRAAQLLPNCNDCFTDMIARAFEGLQEPDSAITYLEETLDQIPLTSVEEHEGALADRLVRLAALYEQVGRNDDAAATWSRFADRWVDADAVLQPRVAAARANAARLSGGGG